MTEDEIKELSTCTKMFMNHVYYVRQSFNLQPNKDHIGACINYVDLQEFREEFCEELQNTITAWVYSQTEAKRIIDEMMRVRGDEMNAQSAFRLHTVKKFKNRGEEEIFINGQFGELLLFNFLQGFFNAVPILRKMRITTSSGMERYGADAIHYSIKDDKNLIFIGEAKTYASDYRFKQAFKESLESITDNYNNHRKELGLYVHESFIDEPLKEIVNQYKDGTLKNTELNLVSIITYQETKELKGDSETKLKEEIVKIIERHGSKLLTSDFAAIDPRLLPRFNYIILPIWKLDDLLKNFQTLIGK